MANHLPPHFHNWPSHELTFSRMRLPGLSIPMMTISLLFVGFRSS
ncbi:hypothetical protein SAMN05216569_2162 [Pseudoxanthomonas sp. CF125]|nr:hypothetical protein SAMN05216569_2162 [Pseudoxanthomonas sp. CF125]